MERAVMVFPDPDSPTMPTTSPRSTLKLTPSTAVTVPPDVWNCTRRAWTLTSGASSLAPHPGLEGVAQPGAEPLETHECGGQVDRRRKPRSRRAGHPVVAVG